MKVLFLDFDGVMHRLNQGHTFTNAPVLWSILESLSDLNVVISSSWREHYPFEKMVKLMTQGGGEHLANRMLVQLHSATTLGGAMSVCSG